MHPISALPVRRLPIGVDVTLGDGAGGHGGVQGQRGRRGRPVHLRGRVDIRVRAGLLDAHLKGGFLYDVYNTGCTPVPKF